MSPWDPPDGEGGGETSRSCPRLPSPSPPTPGSARTGTYPGCRRGRARSTPAPAPRTRSQFAAAAALASCELCAAGGGLGAPSRSAWVPVPGDGEAQPPERYLGSSGAGAGAGAAPLRGEGLRTPASWPAGKVGGEARGVEVGARGAAELRVPLAACAHRAPWLCGEAAPRARWRWRPWLAGLAQSWRWSRYLAARARGAAALAASPGAAPGEHSVRPRAPRRRSRSQHPPPPPPPSLAAAASRGAEPGGPGRAGGRQAGRARGTCDPRCERPRRRPSPGRALHGNFLSGCWRLRLEAVAPPACSSRLPSPPSRPPLTPLAARVLLLQGALARALLPCLGRLNY